MDIEELRIFEDAADRFLDENAGTEETARWRDEGAVSKEMWLKAGRAGLLGLSITEEYGGAGADLCYEGGLIGRPGRKTGTHLQVPLQNADWRHGLVGKRGAGK